MNDDSVKLTHEAWGFFVLRWVVLAVVSLLYYLLNSSSGRTDITGNIFVTFFVGGVINAAFLVLAYYPAFRRAVPVTILVGDWILAGLYIGLGFSNPLLLLGVGAGLMLTGALQLQYFWSIVQSLGIVAILGGGTIVAHGNEVFNTLTPSFILLAGFGIVTFVISYVRSHMAQQQHRELEVAQRRSRAMLETMRERNRVINDMTVTLSATLNPDRVLEVALEAGIYGANPNKRDTLISAALLFREDGALHVAHSRGFTRNDMANVVPGEAGIIGRALVKCEPVFGKDARRDPELQFFAGFQQVRSLLCIPLHANYDNFGVLIYGSKDADAFNRDDTDLLTAIGTQTTIALHNAVLYRNLLEEKERIINVDEDARHKLARDLHDGPTQNVSAIAMRMSYIYRLLERRPEEVPAELKKVEELARKTTREIRDMLFTLRPLVLESQGLEAALQQLCQKTLETHGQHVAARVGPGVEKVLGSHEQGVIFYIIEEAVGNARKHAEAELISIDVNRQNDVVVVEISDNGVGFDADAVNANYDQRGSLGMVNMRERTALLDGSLRIESAEGRGTTITVVLPLRNVPGEGSEITATKKNTRTALGKMLGPRVPADTSPR